MILKPAWRQALSRGAVIVRDDCGLAEVIREAVGVKLLGIGGLRCRVKELIKESFEV